MRNAPCVFPTCDCQGGCRYSAPVRDTAFCQWPGCNCRCFCGYRGPPPQAKDSPGPARLPPMPHNDIQWAHGEPCPYCGVKMDMSERDRQPSRDHIHPRSRGGINGASNTSIVCKSCNEDKNDRTLAEWADDLIWAADPRAKHVHAFLKSREREQDAEREEEAA